MNSFRVYLRTKAGMHAQYDGYVDVVAEDEEQATSRAIDKLKKTSFPGYPRSCWIVEGVKQR